MGKSEIEIIGNGYSKDVEIGEKFLQEEVVNMWEFAPKGAFVYHSRHGTQMILKEYTKTGGSTYSTTTIMEKDVTQEIKDALTLKGQKVIS